MKKNCLGCYHGKGRLESKEGIRDISDVISGIMDARGVGDVCNGA